MARNSIQQVSMGIQAENARFNIRQVQLITPSGRLSGVYGNEREDNGDIVGTTSAAGYGIVQYGDLLDTTAQAMALEGFDMAKSEIKTITTGKGERMYSTITFKENTLKNKVGDIFGLAFKVSSSHDRSLTIEAEGGLMRLCCTNGMWKMANAFALTQRHTTKVNLDFVRKVIATIATRAPELVAYFDSLNDRTLTDTQGLNVIDNLVDKGAFSKLVGKAVGSNWLRPASYDANNRNLYGLYNAMTQYTTHSLEESRFEYSNKVTLAALGLLKSASENDGTFESLIKPVEKKEKAIIEPVYVNAGFGDDSFEALLNR